MSWKSVIHSNRFCCLFHSAAITTLCHEESAHLCLNTQTHTCTVKESAKAGLLALITSQHLISLHICVAWEQMTVTSREMRRNRGNNAYVSILWERGYVCARARLHVLTYGSVLLFLEVQTNLEFNSRQLAAIFSCAQWTGSPRLTHGACLRAMR